MGASDGAGGMAAVIAGGAPEAITIAAIGVVGTAAASEVTQFAMEAHSPVDQGEAHGLPDAPVSHRPCEDRDCSAGDAPPVGMDIGRACAACAIDAGSSPRE